MEIKLLFNKILLGIVFTYFWSPDLFSQAGYLDPSFDGDGIFAANIRGSSDIVNAVAIQTNGKIVLAGGVYGQSYDNSDIAVCRYNLDGSLDNGFGYQGKIIADVFGKGDEAHAISIQSNGKILLAGYATRNDKTLIALVRYNADGSNDISFGLNGIVTTDFGQPLFTKVYAKDISIQSDGKIVLVCNGNDRLTILRYNVNGTLDSSFDGDGIVQTNNPFDKITVGGLELQADGKIVISGSVLNSNISKIFVTRYNSNGSLDTNFGINGISRFNFDTTSNPTFSSEGHCLAINKNGEIVVAGVINSIGSNSSRIGVAQFNANGSIDLTFGSNGQVILDSGEPRSLGIQSDGKILIGAYYSWFDMNLIKHSYVGIIKCNSNGSLDFGFGSNGKTEADIIKRPALPGGGYIAIQGDNKIILAVTGAFDGGPDEDMLVSRFNQNGFLDKSFDADGIAVAKLAVSTDRGMDVVLLDNGTSYALGKSSLSDDEIAVMKLNVDGSLNQSFGKNGKISIPEIGIIGGKEVSFDIEKDGNLVVATSILSGNVYDLATVRILPDGQIHNFFGVKGGWNIPLNARNDFSTEVKVDKNDRIVVACSGITGKEFVVVRLKKQNGDLDNTFGASGKVIVDFGTESSCNSLAILDNGKILLAGNTTVNGVEKIALVRLNDNGSYDNTFGTNGRVVTSISGTLDVMTANDVAVQNDGKIIVVGQVTSFTSGGSYVVLRYTSSGAVDQTFGNSGFVKIPITDVSNFPTDEAKRVVLQNDGKIIICGAIGTSSEDGVGIVRCNIDGSIDKSFGTNGLAITQVPGSWVGHELGVGLGLQKDGKIVVVGTAQNELGLDTQNGFSVYRYNGLTTGTKDQLESTMEVYFSPNPVSGKSSIILNRELASATMCISNTHGHIIENYFNLNGKIIEFDKGKLISGVYFVQLMENNRIVWLGSFIVE
ncbi:MAG: hypothetical protein IPM48_01875 [Saprospiraceae bacterium]|nr:hypothetical protein [Saprospiraceae bacterium]